VRVRKLSRPTGRSGIGHDLVAAAVVTTLLIPAGMGYAQAAGLPPVTGLYATVLPLLIYAVLGPTRTLILGPDSSLAPIIAAAILPLAAGDPDRAVALAGLLAVLSGALLLAGGLLRLGFIMDLLSKPIRLGYLNGVALTIIVTQAPKLLGFSTSGESLFGRSRDFIRGIAAGEMKPTAAAIGVIALGTILVVRRTAPRVPIFLLAMVGATVVVAWLDLDIPVVGSLPGGLPAPALGGLGWADVVALLPAAAGLAVVAFADTGVLSHTLAVIDGEKPSDSREMVALGASNLAAGAFGGFPISGSASRTPVARASGARSRLTGVFAAVAVAVLVLAAPGATRFLPSSVLAAVVVIAALSLADPGGIFRLRRARPTEFGLALVAFAGVAAFGVLNGIAVAVGLSLMEFVTHAWRPYMAELGRVDHRKGYHDLERHPDGRRIPGLVIARFDAPLFFANASVFASFIRRLVDGAPEPVRWVVVAAEPVTDVDATAAEALVALDDELRRRNIRLVFAELKGPVKDRLNAYGLAGRFPPDRFFPTLGTAVSSYVATTKTTWVDWTDRPLAKSEGIERC
jgi:high affinity sulfate transporter 1